MHRTLLEDSAPDTALLKDAERRYAPGQILARVFQTLERAGTRYCVLHGYEEYPDLIKSDVDAVIDSGTSPRELLTLLRRNRVLIGAEVIRCSEYHITLAGRHDDGSPCLLVLDFSADCALDGLHLYSGEEVLGTRHRHREFWVPAANVEFGCYLSRSIAKGVLDNTRSRRLSRLYGQEPAGCAAEIARFWSKERTELLMTAAASGDWEPVRRQLGSLQKELRRRTILRHPGRFAARKLSELAARIRRVYRPDGVSVVLLGPDGAGKSSITDALPQLLAGAFPRSACWGFAPPLSRLFRRSSQNAVQRTDQPHALPPRSLTTSVVRAAYWLAYEIFGYARLRLALTRSTLVLNDRHFVDILVDAKRYRYGGPPWLLSLVWRLIPKPDLIILLDAPAEVLQTRKQEVSLDETARQRRAYLEMVRTFENGRIVDASRPFERVANDVSRIILGYLNSRLARRLAATESGNESGGELDLLVATPDDAEAQLERLHREKRAR